MLLSPQDNPFLLITTKGDIMPKMSGVHLKRLMNASITFTTQLAVDSSIYSHAVIGPMAAALFQAALSDENIHEIVLPKEYWD